MWSTLPATHNTHDTGTYSKIKPPSEASILGAIDRRRRLSGLGLSASCSGPPLLLPALGCPSSNPAARSTTKHAHALQAKGRLPGKFLTLKLKQVTLDAFTRAATLPTHIDSQGPQISRAKLSIWRAESALLATRCKQWC